MKGFAARMEGSQEYYFSKKLREVNRLIQEGKPILNLGIGSPDLSPASEVIEALKNAASNERIHGYQSYQGLPELRTEMAAYYSKNFDVTLDPESEILPLAGSKEGIMHISMAFLNPGDEVLIPDPGYPTYGSVTQLLGGICRPYYLDLNQSGRPNLEDLESQGLDRVKLMWINYPHMPTGAQGNQAIFKELLAFAKRHDIVLVHDNPYAHILNPQPQSILSLPEAKSHAMELNSLSKTYNIPGWRIGMLCGRKDWVDAVIRVKSNQDSGMFYGLQKGAIEALKLGPDWFDRLNEIYTKRRILVWKLAELMDLSVQKEQAGLFVWGKVPSKQNAEELVDKLLYEDHIFITPGKIFGPSGESYVRISLCQPEYKIQEAIQRIKKKLTK